MENKKSSTLFISAAFIVLTLVEVVLLVLQLQEITEATRIITKSLEIIACACAVAYLITGHKKNSAIFFKIFLGTYGLAYVLKGFYYLTYLTAAHATVTAGDIIILIFNAVSFFIICAFFSGKDMGKNVSMGLALIFLMSCVITMICTIAGSQFSSLLSEILSRIVDVIIPVLLIIIITLKYKDKETRQQQPAAFKAIPSWASMLVTAALLSFIGYNLYSLFGTSTYYDGQYFNAAFSTFAAIYALIYCEMGFSKKGASYFKLFSIFFACIFVFRAVSNLLMLLDGTATNSATVTIAQIVLEVFIVVFANVLAISKNQGKKSSLEVAALTFVLMVPEIGLTVQTDAPTTFGNYALLVFPIILIIDVYAKYRDKDERGTV